MFASVSTLTNPCLFIHPVHRAGVRSGQYLVSTVKTQSLLGISAATGSEQDPGPGLVLNSPVPPCALTSTDCNVASSRTRPLPLANPRIRNVLTQMLPVLQRRHALSLSPAVFP